MELNNLIYGPEAVDKELYLRSPVFALPHNRQTDIIHSLDHCDEDGNIVGSRSKETFNFFSSSLRNVNDDGEEEGKSARHFCPRTLASKWLISDLYPSTSVHPRPVYGWPSQRKADGAPFSLRWLIIDSNPQWLCHLRYLWPFQSQYPLVSCPPSKTATTSVSSSMCT